MTSAGLASALVFSLKPVGKLHPNLFQFSDRLQPNNIFMKTCGRLILLLLAGNASFTHPLLADAPSGAAALPAIIPNGIIKLFGQPQVMFKVRTTPAPGQPDLSGQSFLLGEGDGQAGITVKTIDAQTGHVTFDNHGVIQKLTLVTGTAWSSAPGTGPELLAANNPLHPHPVPLVRRMNLADDPRQHQSSDSDAAINESGITGFASFSPGAPDSARPQPADNAQKLAAVAATAAAYAASGTPLPTPGTSLPTPSDALAPAEQTAQDIIAGGDVPPPPPAPGN
jgi:hypothetical protein